MKYFDWFRLFVAECRKLEWKGNLSPDGGFEDWYIEGKRTMKYYLTILSEFLKEIGRQNDLMYFGNSAPFKKPHWIKTRKGFRTAFIYAKVTADIMFSKPPFDV